MGQIVRYRAERRATFLRETPVRLALITYDYSIIGVEAPTSLRLVLDPIHPPRGTEWTCTTQPVGSPFQS